MREPLLGMWTLFFYKDGSNCKLFNELIQDKKELARVIQSWADWCTFYSRKVGFKDMNHAIFVGMWITTPSVVGGERYHQGKEIGILFFDHLKTFKKEDILYLKDVVRALTR